MTRSAILTGVPKAPSDVLFAALAAESVRTGAEEGGGGGRTARGTSLTQTSVETRVVGARRHVLAGGAAEGGRTLAAVGAAARGDAPAAVLARLVAADVGGEAVGAGVAGETQAAVAATAQRALRVRVMAALAQAVVAGVGAARVASLAVLAAVKVGAHAHVVPASREAQAAVPTGGADARPRRLTVVAAVAVPAPTHVAAVSVDARAAVVAGVEAAAAAVQQLAVTARVAGPAGAVVTGRVLHAAHPAVPTRRRRARLQPSARHTRVVPAAPATEATVTRD